MLSILKDGFKELSLELTDEAARRFQLYYDYLTQRNAVMNLTAINGEADTARLHFLDCAALCKIYPFAGKSVIDIGTGAGFPGLPLKITQPSIELCLLDGTKKRVDFLQETCQILDFPDVRCLYERAENAAADIGGSFDVAVSRAVARLNVLCELCLPFVHVGGVFIAMKGPDCRQELLEASNAISILGGGGAKIEKYIIPGTDIIHSAVIIKKQRPTPPVYPRNFGHIKKQPL